MTEVRRSASTPVRTTTPVRSAQQQRSVAPTTSPRPQQRPANLGDSASGVNQRNSAQSDPVAPGAQFPSRGGANAGATIDRLRTTFVRGDKVPLSKMGALDREVDAMLSNPAMRAALIDRYDLDSADNRKALMAVGTMESGGNGDLGETMTTTMNRALTQNIMREMTGRASSRKVTIKDVVNQPGQYESASRVNAVINGSSRVHQNWGAYREQAGQVADQIISGQSTFRQNASNTYYFRGASYGANNSFKIGAHHFAQSPNRQHYVQDALQQLGGINHNR
jgi:hypothetical protein